MQDVWILSIIRDEQEWDLRCVQASACVLVPHWMTPPPPFFLLSVPPPEGASNIPVMGFLLLLLSS